MVASSLDLVSGHGNKQCVNILIDIRYNRHSMYDIRCCYQRASADISTIPVKPSVLILYSFLVIDAVESFI